MSDKKEFMKKVAEIQRTLKAPKSQYNSFGKYSYRNCEDILEGANSVLGSLVLTLSDDVKMIGDRIYVQATATLTDGENSISNTAFARESASKKGMDDSQLTGSTSSYARKYALNGLFCIDDTKDADACDGITAALANGEINWIKENWQLVIIPNWDKLDGNTQAKLNQLCKAQ